jgi:DNA-binding transcriptional ArsR family regulator
MALATTVEMIHDPGRAGVLLDPIRMELLERLREPDSAAGLARKMSLPRQKLNYHLRELEREGFLELLEERRKGNCVERVLRATARTYVIDPGILGALGVDPNQFQDRLSAGYLVAVAAKTIRDVGTLRQRAEKSGKRLATFTLQTEVRFASASDRAAFVEELTGSIARLAAKYHDEHAEGGRRFQFVLSAYPTVAAATKPSEKNKSKESS